MHRRDPAASGAGAEPAGRAADDPAALSRRRFLVAGGAAAALTVGAGLAIGRTGTPRAEAGLRALTVADRHQAWRQGEPWRWSRFREVPVSLIDNKVRLDAAGGVGTATGVGGPSANDRRFYVLRDLEASDVEVAAEFSSTAMAQFGFALRVQPGRAVVAWHNIYYAANANLIQGVWEYDGRDLLSTNQQGALLRGFAQPVQSAVGDGTTVTVTTPGAHRLSGGDVVVHEAEVAELGQAQIHTVPGPTSYTFASDLQGSWTGGVTRRVSLHDRRRAAVRLVGTQVTFKQWLPGELEPAWDDPLRTATNVLPDALPSGAAPPVGPGSVGILASHLGDGEHVEVTGFRATPLG